MKDEIIKVTFKALESDRANLKIKAANARCSQAELLLHLLYNYGDQAVADMLRKRSSFVEEGGLPNYDEAYPIERQDDYDWESYKGTPAAIASDSVQEQSIAPIYITSSGQLSLHDRDESGNRITLASLSDLREQQEWVDHAVAINWYVRVQEGVFVWDTGVYVWIKD